MTNTRRQTAPVEVRSVPQKAIEQALKLADGDRARLKIEADGTITVLNKPRAGNRPTR